jgi:hypothetical protein
MKFFPGHRRPLFRSSTFVWLALGVGILLFAGCGKKQPAAETPAAAPAVEAASAPASGGQPVFMPPAAPVTVAVGTDGGADLKQLNHAYIGWVLQNRRRPKSFDDFIAMSGIHVPPPPAGKKYVIDKNGFINFANN